MPPALTTTLSRLRRLAVLDETVFDELRFDTNATLPGILTTAVGLFALGLGGWLWWLLSDLSATGSVFLKTVVLGAVFGFVAWVGWLLIVYTLLRRLAGITVEIEQLIRTAGFASASLLVALGMVAAPVAFGVGVFALVAWVGATQQAIERTVGRGGGDLLLANLAGFAAWVVVMSLLATGTNQIGPGPFLAESVWDAIASARVTLG